MFISRKLLHSLQTSYLVPRYNTISDISWHKSFWPWLKVKVTAQGQRSQTWRCLRSLNASCFFHHFKIQPLIVPSTRNCRGFIFLLHKLVYLFSFVSIHEQTHKGVWVNWMLLVVLKSISVIDSASFENQIGFWCMIQVSSLHP